MKYKKYREQTEKTNQMNIEEITRGEYEKVLKENWEHEDTTKKIVDIFIPYTAKNYNKPQIEETETITIYYKNIDKVEFYTRNLSYNDNRFYKILYSSFDNFERDRTINSGSPTSIPSNRIKQIIPTDELESFFETATDETFSTIIKDMRNLFS